MGGDSKDLFRNEECLFFISLTWFVNNQLHPSMCAFKIFKKVLIAYRDKNLGV